MIEAPVNDHPMGLFHPARGLYRFSILAFASLMAFGSYFAYDSVGAIETTLIQAFHTNRAAIGSMYTMYSVAAVFAVLAGGVLIDRAGVRRASLIMSTLVVAGAAIVAWAPNLATTYAGRIIFGMGSESMIVAQSAIVARWFTGKELALGFGITLTVSRLGTLFSFNTEQLLADRLGFRGALWIAAGLCLLSLVANWIYTEMDRHAEPILKLPAAGSGDKIRWSDVGRFPASYWFLVAICVTFYSAIFPFTALSTDFFHDKWGLPMAAGEGLGFLAGVFYNITHLFTTAQGTTSIIITASMFLAPFAGNLVDRIGRRATLMVLGSILMVPAHLILGLTTVSPVIPMIVLGAAFVLVPACVWPCVPLVVDESRVGTAFGLMTAFQNIGLAVFPLLNGSLRDQTHGYTASQIMFAALGAAGLVFSVLLLHSDRRSGHKLERAR
ncbi:MAG TPA: MFS transporter [Bryobacteraceae bacterium]|nr:MFS transporter [Bryobacteraceae bacterium]